MNTSGWNLLGAARLANIADSGYTELNVCPFNQPSGAVFFQQPINLSICSHWKAEFDFRLYDGTGADGLAFCFLDVPPSGFVVGGGLGIPATANGLKVCFDTWNNCIPYDPNTVHDDMPKVELRWGKGYDECGQGPTAFNSSGKLSFIRSPNYNHAEITYDKGNIQVFVNDSLLVSGFQLFNFTGYLGFTASTGGYNDNQSIKNVVIYTEMPPSYAGNSAAICPNDTVSIGGEANPNYTYSWFPAKGLSDTSASSTLVQLTNDSASSQVHTYYVHTAFKSNPGCASIDSVKIKVYPEPIINFITPEICLHDASAQFTDSSYTNDNSTLPFSYTWNFGDPNSIPSNPNTSSAQNPSHHYSAAENYTVGLKVSNSKGCTDSTTKIFTVNGAFPKAVFDVVNGSTLCSNKAVQLSNQSSVDFGSITKLQFFWGDSTGISTVDEEPYPGKIYSHHYPPPITSADSFFTVKMVAFSGISCQNVLTETVKVLRAPQIQYTPIAAVCDNSMPFSIMPYATVTGFQGNFSYSGTGVSDNGLFNPKMAGEGTATIIYTFAAANNCVDSGSQQLTIIPSPNVNAGLDLYLLKGESGQIQATASGSDLEFIWYPALYLNNETILQPTSTPLDDIVYTLTATGAGGCKDSSDVAVKILPEPEIPNAFTPNHDGLNDTWGIRYLDLYVKCDVKVFNRFGQLVFHSQGYQQPWDGTFKGEPLPTGVYVYIIDTKRQKNIYKGTVTLIR
ncbi:MAG: gliding motility-associated C-terminal domain-containing protein [Ginsengibacter sp.]